MDCLWALPSYYEYESVLLEFIDVLALDHGESYRLNVENLPLSAPPPSPYYNTFGQLRIEKESREA